MPTRRVTDGWLVKWRNILTIAVSSLMIVGALSSACWAFIDWRIDEKQEPIYREIVYLNCLIGATLTEKQQEHADKLFESVKKMDKKRGEYK